LAATLVVGSVATAGWYIFQRHETQHAGELLAREAYATRSYLVKELDRQFEALRSVARYWSDYGHLASDQWGDDAQIEVGHFHGFDELLWSDPARAIRYASSESRWNYRPDDQEWQALQLLLEGVEQDGQEHVFGPRVADDRQAYYRVQVPSRGPGSSGLLVASINATEQLDQILADQSPGHALSVSWDDDDLYTRGTIAPDFSESWVASGLIEISLGPLWRVTHAPTAQLADELSRPTLPGLLAASWLIAVLFGGLVYLNARVLERVHAAERAELRYAKLNSELESRVSDRTKDLETISQSVVHDIRTPLSTIVLNCKLLKEMLPKSGSMKVVERIDRSVVHITTILERIQTYAAVTVAELNRELVDMRSVAQDSCHKFTENATALIRIDDIPPCNAQPVLVEILWHNLVSNALKFTRNTPSPEITVGAETKSNPTLYFVKDNGPGFDESRNEDIFAPFVRLNRQDHPGEGLGLAIVARIVQRHGGRVWAESQPGAGAVFKFELGRDSVAR
jgi:signal transduction histidine kinase